LLELRTVGNVTTLMEDEPIENTVSVNTVEEPVPTSSTVTISSTDEEDDTMDYFQKLADDS